jgi:hypothetical protein
MMAVRAALTSHRRLFPRHSLQGTSITVNDAASTRNITQENRGSPATPSAAAAPLGRKLLCTVQRQICIYFNQLMNSF